MSKRTIIWLIIAVLILTGGTILCILRWNAWFVMPAEPEWTGGDTISTRFVTFNEDTMYACQYADTLHLVVLGDVHNTLTHSDYMRIAEQCPDMQCYAQVGDFVDREQFYYKQLLKRELQGTPFDSLPVIVCPGNHEYTKGTHCHLPDSWYESFPMPHNGPSYDKGSTYYVDFRDMRFIAIDTENPRLISEHTRLNTWVKSVISSAWQPWVVVIMHRPVYASRKGRVNPTVWLSLVNALQGADVIFSGHDHTYARRGKTFQDEHSAHTPVWLGISSTTRAGTLKDRSRMDTVIYGGPYYEQMRVTRHELAVRCFQLDGSCIDSVMLYRK
ncbi:MAG: metallophosphoesterase [Paludibacteraceae bacterium]|nr:metallophosphoesterase [Paludibacteraceae bacterium]